MTCKLHSQEKVGGGYTKCHGAHRTPPWYHRCGAWTRGFHTETHCNTLQHTALHYSTPYHCTPPWHDRCDAWTRGFYTATHYNTLQHTKSSNTAVARPLRHEVFILQHTATHCNTPNHPTPPWHDRCDAWTRGFYTAAHYNTLQHTKSSHTAVARPLRRLNTRFLYCNTLQHTATHKIIPHRRGTTVAALKQ